MSDQLTETLVEEPQDELKFPASLPVLPLKDTVVFPESVTPLAIGQERSIKLIEDVVSGNRVLALLTVKNPEAEQPGWDDLYEVGTAAVIHKMIKVPDGTLRILVQGAQRIKLDNTVQDDPYLVGEFVELPDELAETPEVEALTRNVQGLFGRVIGLVPYLPEELQIAAANVDAPSALCNLVASTRRLKTSAADYVAIRTYLDWSASLPWHKTTEDNLDLDNAKQVLDEDHFDLEKVKERILEHLAVSKLKNDTSGPILCFMGPPGVGKTSLGQSISRALGRKFARLSVGGVRDEAEIRGHRRTYIGAMPGTIIRHLRDAESMNPVMLIDEIDKMGADFRGDPASAMLEVLDPEQNKNFRDHYLDLPFDLSKTLFICTANTLDTVPAPLLDRMDVIQLSGYTEVEKFGIAKRYLVPKQVEAHGLGGDQGTITDKALRLLIREYTREAGVRNLERRLADVLRKAARQIAEGKLRAKRLRVDEKRVRASLGPRR